MRNIWLSAQGLARHVPRGHRAGRFLARVAVTYVGNERTRSQRFLDLKDEFSTEAEAVECARLAGISWVETTIRAR